MSNSTKTAVRNVFSAVGNLLDVVGTTAVVSTEIVKDVTGAAAGTVRGVVPTTKAVTAATVKFSLGMANADKSVADIEAMYDSMDLEAMLDGIDTKAITAGQSVANAWNDEEDTKQSTKPAPTK